jgi:hypothetical protein
LLGAEAGSSARVCAEIPRQPDQDLFYVEGHLGNLYLEKDVGVATRTSSCFRSISEVALDPDQTAALIRSLLNRGSSK